MSRRFNINARNDRDLGHINKNNSRITSQQSGTEEAADTENGSSDNNASPKAEKIKNTIENAKNIKNIDSSSEVDKLAKVKLKIPVAVKVKLILLAVAIFLLVFLLVFITIIITGDSDTSNGLAIEGYYDIGCDEVTVNFADKSKNYEIVGTGTYSLEEYVAGVVQAEVGQFNNEETFKEFAIAARTYFAANYTPSSNDSCIIESSDRYQVFSTGASQLAQSATEATAGKVLLSDNELAYVEYDAFCTIEVTDTEYTLRQQNQKIPRSWADSQSGIAAEWKKGTCEGNHGRGISQWGSYYLATKKDMEYDELLKYYLGDDITISNSSMQSIAGLEIKNTTDAKALHEPLSTFLPEHGSSVADLDNFIYTNVDKNGRHTRAGVVTAAVSLINYLYDGAQVRLPYYWGGDYQRIGVNPEFGGKAYRASISIHGNAYHYNGFDCSGFVSWAIKNGGFDISRKSTSGFHSAYSGDSCVITDASCKGQPGDLINSNGCHVQMIVSVDENSGRYYVAESTGSKGLIMRAWGMHEGNCGKKETRILHMDSLYGS